MKKFLASSLALAALSLAVSAPANAQVTTLTEGFANVSGLSGSGWAFQNNSNPGPVTATATANWLQGVAGFNGQTGTVNPTAYIYVGTDSSAGDTITGDGGVVSNWLLTPELDFTGGGTFSFFTRTTLGNPAGEQLNVRLSTSGSSTNVGTSPTSVGVFTTLLQTIGNLSVAGSYPGSVGSNNAYQLYQYSVTLPTSGSGRIGFNYVGNDGGPNGTTNQFIALDTASYTAAVPEPSAVLGTLMLGGFAFAGSLRKKAKA
jgi:hypothetical protein